MTPNDKNQHRTRAAVVPENIWQRQPRRYPPTPRASRLPLWTGNGSGVKEQEAALINGAKWGWGDGGWGCPGAATDPWVSVSGPSVCVDPPGHGGESCFLERLLGRAWCAFFFFLFSLSLFPPFPSSGKRRFFEFRKKGNYFCLFYGAIVHPFIRIKQSVE